jgi:hypothetical protein
MKIALILVALCVTTVGTFVPTGDAWARGQTCQKHCGVLTSASVHAAPAQLPATMLGGWCPTTDRPNIYTHSKAAKGNANCINIRRDSYGWVEGSCKIKKVKPTTVQSYRIYHVYSRCEAEALLHLREHRVFELQGNELYVGVPK